MTKINLNEKLAAFDERWSPRIIAAVQGMHVKLAKLEGEFPWHSHDEEDELFLVLRGTLRLEFRDGQEELGPGELLVVPRGIEHRPVAKEEVHVLLVEPATTLNTGNVRNEQTIEAPHWI